MLNRNNLFGKQEGKLDEKPARNFGPGALPGGADAMQPIEPATPTPAMPRLQPGPASAPQPAQEPPGSRLIVGPNIKLKGVEITDCDTLVVEGHVEATMDSRTIQIAEPGTFSGTVGVDVAEVRGRFSGELTARKRLVIYKTGKVSGKIRYGKLVVEEGGELSGDVNTLASREAEKSAVVKPIAEHSTQAQP